MSPRVAWSGRRSSASTRAASVASPAYLDRTVGLAEHGPRRQHPVVQAARAGTFQRGGRLADDPAGLLGEQASVGEDRGDRASAVEGLLDDERGRVVTAHVEDADQPLLVDARRPPRRVERR